MSYYSQGYQSPPASQNAQNLQFFPSSYSGVSGHTTPSQASYAGYGGANTVNAYPQYGSGIPPNFGAQGVSGRMGEQGGLRTGWIAAFSTEGYEGEPGLMEELGVNFGHIMDKVCPSPFCAFTPSTTWFFRALAALILTIISTDTNCSQPPLSSQPTHHG